MNERSWLVVGGGIGGLSTALALARAGQQVRLIERAARFSEIGAGLQLGANATRSMASLGILPAVEAIAVHPGRGLLMDALTGDRLTVLDLGDAYRARYGFPYLVMHRSDLLDILVDACRAHGVTLENGKHVVSVDADLDGGRVRCADGSTYAADVLVGADGFRSKVRTLIDASEPLESGYVAFRGTLKIGAVRSGVASDDVLIWIGPKLHLVQYPIRRSELYNQVAVFHSDVWSSGAGDTGTPEELDARFSVTCAPVRAAVEQIDRSRSWPIYERDPLPTWRSGRAVLTGDAAHPMLQYLGQGACQAMEDAVTLAALVDSADDAVDRALERFEALRLPQTARCQRTARPWGELWHTTDSLTMHLRNRVLQARAADDYSETDWLYADRREVAVTA